jgi:hypothetical protein
MNKFQAVNFYLSSYDVIYIEIVNAIMNYNSKSKTVYDKTIQRDITELKHYLNKFN